MPDRVELHRYRRLVAELSIERSWQLDLVRLEYYAERVRACFDAPDGPSDALVRQTIVNFHEDHRLVEALRDAGAHESGAVWAEWSSIVLRVVAQRTGRSTLGDDAAAELEDLRQEALIDLWRGLAGFRYQSRFRTWAVTVIANALARRYRNVTTHKRAAQRAVRSLDAVGESLIDEQTPAPEVRALSSVLVASVQRILAGQPDRRLGLALQLWVQEDQSMREIGRRLQLSPARVHGLIRQACELLSVELRNGGWLVEEAVSGTRVVGISGEQ